MISGSLARRYARALLDLGTEKGTLEQLASGMDELAAMLAQSKELMEALINPAFPFGKRKEVLAAVMTQARLDPTLLKFTLVLQESDRIAYVPAIARQLREMVDQRTGRLRGTVTSVTPLSNDQMSQVKAGLEKATGKQVLLDRREDPLLLGGLVAKVGDLVFDGSLRTQLEQLRERILQD